MKRIIKLSLLPKVIIAIILGSFFSLFLPDFVVRIFVTINGIFSNFLSFIIPLLILGLVAPGIADMGKGAGRMLLLTALIAYGSTIAAGFFSFFTTQFSLPLLLDVESLDISSQLNGQSILTTFFEIDMPPLMSVTTSLILAMVLGLGVSIIQGESFKALFNEFRSVIILIINSVIIPFLPIYIFGIFLKIGADGEVITIFSLFFKVIVIIFIMHILLLMTQFLIAGYVAKVNPFKSFKNMLPAYMTALGTQSSAATIPVTLKQVKINGVKDMVADFVVPLCATIHLSGSILKIVACAFAIMFIFGMDCSLSIFFGFILMLGITMVAAPGVPGGAIMAAVALLQSMLGFDSNQVGMMIALYITMDSFGTACNVTGDGAIALIMNKIYKSKDENI